MREDHVLSDEYDISTGVPLRGGMKPQPGSYNTKYVVCFDGPEIFMEGIPAEMRLKH